MKFRCPSCRSGDFTLFERVEVSDTYLIRGGTPTCRGTGDYLRQVGFWAECDCGHRWAPRRKTGVAIIDAEYKHRDDEVRQ